MKYRAVCLDLEQGKLVQHLSGSTCRALPNAGKSRDRCHRGIKGILHMNQAEGGPATFAGKPDPGSGLYILTQPCMSYANGRLGTSSGIQLCPLLHHAHRQTCNHTFVGAAHSFLC